eukprot:TRINITY_DN11511_c0_g1_i1.p1 TRINITY_DN11511_c0_g1~~TRINITY_DN11511_c0_g1_i1.p1  ORF type:complete len:834 (+),score=131.71 TRINITY_DN11511_c0_g1_i1:1-2502(+)
MILTRSTTIILGLLLLINNTGRGQNIHMDGYRDEEPPPSCPNCNPDSTESVGDHLHQGLPDACDCDNLHSDRHIYLGGLSTLDVMACDDCLCNGKCDGCDVIQSVAICVINPFLYGNIAHREIHDSLDLWVSKTNENGGILNNGTIFQASVIMLHNDYPKNGIDGTIYAQQDKQRLECDLKRNKCDVMIVENGDEEGEWIYQIIESQQFKSVVFTVNLEDNQIFICLEDTENCIPRNRRFHNAFSLKPYFHKILFKIISELLSIEKSAVYKTNIYIHYSKALFDKEVDDLNDLVNTYGFANFVNISTVIHEPPKKQDIIERNQCDESKFDSDADYSGVRIILEVECEEILNYFICAKVPPSAIIVPPTCLNNLFFANKSSDIWYLMTYSSYLSDMESSEPEDLKYAHYPGSDSASKFKDAFGMRHGYFPGETQATYYLSGYLTQYAIEAAGLDTTDMATIISLGGIASFSGFVDFDNVGIRSPDDIKIIQIIPEDLSTELFSSKSRRHVVSPVIYSTEDLVYPIPDFRSRKDDFGFNIFSYICLAINSAFILFVLVYSIPVLFGGKKHTWSVWHPITSLALIASVLLLLISNSMHFIDIEIRCDIWYFLLIASSNLYFSVLYTRIYLVTSKFDNIQSHKSGEKFISNAEMMIYGSIAFLILWLPQLLIFIPQINEDGILGIYTPAQYTLEVIDEYDRTGNFKHCSFELQGVIIQIAHGIYNALILFYFIRRISHTLRYNYEDFGDLSANRVAVLYGFITIAGTIVTAVTLNPNSVEFYRLKLIPQGLFCFQFAVIVILGTQRRINLLNDIHEIAFKKWGEKPDVEFDFEHVID